MDDGILKVKYDLYISGSKSSELRVKKSSAVGAGNQPIVYTAWLPHEGIKEANISSQ